MMAIQENGVKLLTSYFFRVFPSQSLDAQDIKSSLPKIKKKKGVKYQILVTLITFVQKSHTYKL